MIAGTHEPTELEGARWKAVQRGLRLANNSLGIGAIGFFYGLWCVIGLLLCLVLIPFALAGKMDAFERALEPVALYGFALPIALMAVTTWVVKLFSRLLWCAIPEPLTAAFLAWASVAGRVSVLFALWSLWLLGGPLGKGLLLPETIACSAIAWLGLVADWGFIRTLRHRFVPRADADISPDKFNNASENQTEAEPVTGQNKTSIWTRHFDFGEWLERRFPRGSKFFFWILLPIASVVLSSLNDKGNLQAIPDALLRLAVIAPALLQAFLIPGNEIDRLIKLKDPS